MDDLRHVGEHTIVERETSDERELLTLTTGGWTYAALCVEPHEWWCEYCSHEGDAFVNPMGGDFEMIRGYGSAGNVRSREEAVLWLLDEAGLTDSDVRPIDPIT